MNSCQHKTLGVHMLKSSAPFIMKCSKFWLTHACNRVHLITWFVPCIKHPQYISFAPGWSGFTNAMVLEVCYWVRVRLFRIVLIKILSVMACQVPLINPRKTESTGAITLQCGPPNFGSRCVVVCSFDEGTNSCDR